MLPTVKDIYDKQYAHFSHMNGLLYQMPPIFSTILGGLWFFAAGYIEKDKVVAAGIFAFSAVAAACFVIALHRFRLAFEGYINNLNRLDGEFKVSIKHSCWPSTISAMVVLVCAAFVISVAGMYYAIIKDIPTINV